MSTLRFALPDAFTLLNAFPTNRDWRLQSGDAVQAVFDWTKTSGRGFFDGVTVGMRTLLDWIEVALVGTPWPVVALIFVMLAYLSGGARVAIFTGAALAYLGLLDFWEKAMTTIALLGAAAMISITLGIPLGIFCARRPKAFAVVRPVLDFMQSMPSFVYLIPVVAFIGSGKPAGVVATMIFGSPPVIRFTVLGLQQVPSAVREAALAFGATPRYLLWRVDLPLARKTIMAGINQTILLSLAMVVVASLIGAKGWGEDVLEALQYAAAGQGILAGLAILFCALILDRIVAGRK
ncbi:ABC transporter permease [Albirhodobacter sp. R86504]|uniref:ABC transporter permease n=1 Tax=Albirhodobacter sp. R86504 TaxID=3093848 RepID=UPI00366B35B4